MESMPMISRSWHGAVPTDQGDSFSRYFESATLKDIAARPGHLGVFVKRQADGGYDHFFLLSYWDSWDSIRAFAGDQPHVAVRYPDDERFALIADPIVLHHECVAIEPWPGQ